MTTLQELNLSYNPIDILDTASLSELKRLRELDIQNLGLHYIDSRVFHNLRQDSKQIVHLLHLSYCFTRIQISDINQNKHVSQIKVFPFARFIGQIVGFKIGYRQRERIDAIASNTRRFRIKIEGASNNGKASRQDFTGCLSRYVCFTNIIYYLVLTYNVFSLH